MTIDTSKHGNVCVVRLAGEIRMGAPTAQLRLKSRELVGAGERFFVLDMLAVPWLDSSGLGEVLACYKRARERDGEVKLVLRGRSHTLFTHNQLNRIFEIFDEPEAAVASFAPPGARPEADA